MSLADDFKAFAEKLFGRSERSEPAPGENKAVPYTPYPVEDPSVLFGLRDVALLSQPGLHGISSVAVRENGCIELFAGKSCGMRIDPNGKITLIADKMVLAASSLDIATSPEGITWNGEIPFQKPALQGVTATGTPVTVFAYSPNDPLDRPAKGILTMAPSSRLLKSVEEWFAEVIGP